MWFRATSSTTAPSRKLMGCPIRRSAERCLRAVYGSCNSDVGRSQPVRTSPLGLKRSGSRPRRGGTSAASGTTRRRPLASTHTHTHVRAPSPTSKAPAPVDAHRHAWSAGTPRQPPCLPTTTTRQTAPGDDAEPLVLYLGVEQACAALRPRQQPCGAPCPGAPQHRNPA